MSVEWRGDKALVEMVEIEDKITGERLILPKLVPTRSDKEIAEDLKRRFVDVLKPVLDLANEAAASEFMTSLSFERDPYGRSILVARLSKHF